MERVIRGSAGSARSKELKAGGRGRSAVSVAGLAAALLAVSPAAGQETPRVEVALAALEHVSESLPRGSAILDPRPFCQAGLAGWMCPPNMAERVRALGLELGSRDFSYVCIESPRDCRIVNTDVLVEFGEPRILGRTAVIAVDVRWRVDDPARPVGRRRSELHLQRVRGVWTVVREQMGVQTSGES